VTLHCESCGSLLYPPRANWRDGDAVTCRDCLSRNHVAVDDELAYVTFFECRHGMENEVRCVNCEEMEAVNG
jgi:uncharacterized OB-fold protein